MTRIINPDDLPERFRDQARRQLDKPRAGIRASSPAPAPRDAQTRRMNKTEARYAARLEAARRAGEIVGFDFEVIRLRLGTQCGYTPDFVLWLPDGGIGMDEVKGGYIREDSKIKFRAAVERYPHIRFRMWQWENGRWSQLL